MKKLLLLTALMSMNVFAQMGFDMGNGTIGDYEPGGAKDCRTLAFFSEKYSFTDQQVIQLCKTSEMSQFQCYDWVRKMTLNHEEAIQACRGNTLSGAGFCVSDLKMEADNKEIPFNKEEAIQSCR